MAVDFKKCKWPSTATYTFKKFIKIDYMVVHKAGLNKFQSIDVTQIVFSENVIKL